MKINRLFGNLYAMEFFYQLEKDSQKDFYTKNEITEAIIQSINLNIDEQLHKKRLRGKE